MTCPTCGHELREIRAGDIKVDTCKGGCGGLWFDQFELKKVDERHETAGEILLDIVRDRSLKIDREKRRLCPKCPTMVLMRHFFSVKKQVEVDECPECGGVWLDPGELATIRHEFKSEADRNKAAEEYFSEIFDGQLAAMRAESEAKLEHARKIAWIFRFICPSYYIPGKQKWGAF